MLLDLKQFILWKITRAGSGIAIAIAIGAAEAVAIAQVRNAMAPMARWEAYCVCSYDQTLSVHASFCGGMFPQNTLLRPAVTIPVESARSTLGEVRRGVYLRLCVMVAALA